MPLLHEVFLLSGVPTSTFVKPERYDEILVSIRTPGRCMVLEGPSGIGKSTTIDKLIEGLGLKGTTTYLTSRKVADAELIAALPQMGKIGTVIVDDFHRLSDDTKAKLSDYMKILADAGTSDAKLILIGINKAGQQLVKHADDVGLRMDVFKLGSNADAKVEELIRLGEAALNV
jgi:ABC-type cobalamin/Fe3+-siderophores transport system ATPase subunit